ncbi:uncharacterized protein LOC144705279 [Wolffia australiana]
MGSSPAIFFLLSLLLLGVASAALGDGGKTSIVFSTVGRSRYEFDIFTLHSPSPSLRSDYSGDEVLLTDGQSINYNGFFPGEDSALLSYLPASELAEGSLQALIYVSERNGTSNIYLNLHESVDINGGGNRRSSLEVKNRRSVALLRAEAEARFSQRDRPCVSGEHLIYVSTHEDSGVPRKSWAAIYSTHVASGETKRLTPRGVVDLSPSVSPSGKWTAVASSPDGSYTGESGELRTSIVVFRTVDGSERTIVDDHGGWPCWGDDSTLYFHRKSDDGWWSIFRVTLNGDFSVASVDRVTPPGFHAFTPATGKGFLVMATRRPTSDYRHIELLDLASGEFVEITRRVSPLAHHFNPFVSPDSSRIGYHRCRGGRGNGAALALESMQSPLEDISLFRIDGHFPSFSPDGRRIAFVELPGLFVMNADGSGKRQISTGNFFPTAWHPKKDVIYSSQGPDFSSPNTKVDVVAISLVQGGDGTLSPAIKKLTNGEGNNAFPSPSPDGKWVVYRSGRSGHNNLYIMDAEEGESKSLRQLTSGLWNDTMCTWSPDGEWIAFSSNRENPGTANFTLFMIHPNGTGLRKVAQSGHGGRVNHASFSPDSRRIVFGTDYAGVSAEVISTPNSVLPYGEIFVANIDGTGLRRLTHNAYEDGTPAWSPTFLNPVDVKEALDAGSRCKFDDQEFLDARVLLSIGSATCLK